ncbi:hypothetical protein DCAR_0209620 [Daucus carota subsp. sativus]|uniref:Uncharacterized protein n=1 Tax=Daucus carota subsp. sativus TaxID=79200 RepID=A0A166FE68_DAUCS|nr:PREDICTED: uncharacterized protein LOC108207881 [Daucus carota subsp. sativus]WOG90376.1 hypothetical protein DCAR_0209620 [Daucus carota subsp. sativus]
MSSSSKSLHNSAVKPSSPPVSDEPKQPPTPQQAEGVNVGEDEAADLKAQPINLGPKKPCMPGGDVGGPSRSVRRLREKKEKLRVSLTEEEIEEDLYSMMGGIATRKTNKRPQSVQKDIDKLFPGSELEGISADIYRTRRGL